MKALFIIIAIAIAIFAIVSIVFFFIPTKNPIWVKKQLKNLEVGEARWILDSPKVGKGHAIALVREITKEHIYFDRYEMRGKNEWTQVTNRSRYAIKPFLNLTAGEPSFGEFLKK